MERQNWELREGHRRGSHVWSDQGMGKGKRHIYSFWYIVYHLFHISATIEVVLLFACLLVFKTVSHCNAQSSLELERPG